MRQIFLLFLLFMVGQWFVKALKRAQTHTRPGADPQQASRRTANGGGASASPGGRARPTAALPEPMVRCAECGVHAPRSESVSLAGESFCCNEHARRHATRAAGQDQDRAAR